jgi:hypothetical protein
VEALALRPRSCLDLAGIRTPVVVAVPVGTIAIAARCLVTGVRACARKALAGSTTTAAAAAATPPAPSTALAALAQGRSGVLRSHTLVGP